MYGHDGVGPAPSLYIGTTVPMISNRAHTIMFYVDPNFANVLYSHTVTCPNFANFNIPCAELRVRAYMAASRWRLTVLLWLI